MRHDRSLEFLWFIFVLSISISRFWNSLCCFWSFFDRWLSRIVSLLSRFFWIIGRFFGCFLSCLLGGLLIDLILFCLSLSSLFRFRNYFLNDGFIYLNLNLFKLKELGSRKLKGKTDLRHSWVSFKCNIVCRVFLNFIKIISRQKFFCRFRVICLSQLEALNFHSFIVIKVNCLLLAEVIGCLVQYQLPVVVDPFIITILRGFGCWLLA